MMTILGEVPIPLPRLTLAHVSNYFQTVSVCEECSGSPSTPASGGRKRGRCEFSTPSGPNTVGWTANLKTKER